MFQKIILSILEGLAITLVIYLATGLKIKSDKIVYFALMIIVTLFVLDLWAPNVASGARQGYGFGSGWSLIGGGNQENFDGNWTGNGNGNGNRHGNRNLNEFGVYASNTPYTPSYQNVVSAKPTIYSSYNNPLAGCPFDLRNLMNSLSPNVQNSDYLEQAKA